MLTIRQIKHILLTWRICKTCQEPKELDDYYKNSHVCRFCTSQRGSSRYARLMSNPTTAEEQRARWRKNHQARKELGKG